MKYLKAETKVSLNLNFKKLKRALEKNKRVEIIGNSISGHDTITCIVKQEKKQITCNTESNHAKKSDGQDLYFELKNFKALKSFLEELFCTGEYYA